MNVKFGFGKETRFVNIPRLATRNRRHWKDGRALIERIAEDGRVTPRELDEWLEWQRGGQAIGTVMDINDQFGRATSVEQVRSLNRERDAWLDELPELPSAA